MPWGINMGMDEGTIYALKKEGRPQAAQEVHKT
jgi:hypothetical protein